MKEVRSCNPGRAGMVACRRSQFGGSTIVFGQSMEGRTKIRSHERMKTVVLTLAGICVVVSLTACGGGGGSPVVVGPRPVDPPVKPSDESLALPSDHGLSAGEIRVAPGGTVERGNVVVSCPAGGPACVVTVAADGTASYERAGGVPSVEAREQVEREARERAEREAREQAAREARERAEREAREQAEREARERAAREARERAEREAREQAEREARERAERETPEQAEREAREQAEREAREQAEQEARGNSRDNPTAEDLLDHWNDPETLRSALGLSAVSQTGVAERKRSLKALLDSADGEPGNAGLRFRNIRLEDVEIIGEKNGITYGQWKSGPAGTFHIEFDWRFADHVDTKYRAEMERVGKKFSYRLLDDFGTHTAEPGSYFHTGYGRWVLGESLTTDGLIISMLSVSDVGFNAFELPYTPRGQITGTETSYDDYEPWWGAIQLEPILLREDGPLAGYGEPCPCNGSRIGTCVGPPFWMDGFSHTFI